MRICSRWSVYGMFLIAVSVQSAQAKEITVGDSPPAFAERVKAAIEEAQAQGKAAREKELDKAAAQAAEDRFLQKMIEIFADRNDLAGLKKLPMTRSKSESVVEVKAWESSLFLMSNDTQLCRLQVRACGAAIDEKQGGLAALTCTGFYSDVVAADAVAHPVVEFPQLPSQSAVEESPENQPDADFILDRDFCDPDKREKEIQRLQTSAGG